MANSRERLLGAAADLLQRRGYDGTGLQDVVKESGAPKGSLYFHFPDGKQQLAAEAISLSGQAVHGALGHLLESAPSVAVAVRRMTELQAKALEGSGFERGCPVAATALDVGATVSEPVRAACDTSFSSWIDVIAEALRAEGMTRARARTEATFALSTIEGALILARVSRDAGPVRTAGRELERRLKEAA